MKACTCEGVLLTMHSEWCVLQASMWSMAASTPSTTRRFISSASYSVPQQPSSAATVVSGASAWARSSAWMGQTPSRARTPAMRGTKASATAASTSRVSIALHTLGREHFAFTTMRSAISRSADVST